MNESKTSEKISCGRNLIYTIRLPNTLANSIDVLQRQLHEFKCKLPGATTSTSSALAIPSAADASPSVLKTGRSQRLHPEYSVPNGVADVLDAYAGPTSFTFGMNTADARLCSISQSAGHLSVTEGSSSGPEERSLVPDSPNVPTQTSRDVNNETSLESFSLEDVTTCLDTFQNVFGVLHPLPHLEKIRLNAQSLLRAAKRSLWSQPIDPGHCGLLEMLKIIIAIALVAQAGGQTKLSKILYQSLEPMISTAILHHVISHDFRSFLLLVV